LDSGAKIFWIDILSTKNDKFILPYKKELLEESQNFLVKKDTKDITSEDFSKINEIDEDITIIRPKDILELFNTDTDLTGEDIDISRFIRNDNSTNVQVFWRDFKNDDQYINEPFPKSNELCSAPIQDVKALVKKKNEVLFAWDFFEGMWVKLQDPNNIFPGRMIMLKALSGHYSKTEGWNPDLKEKVDCALYNIKEKGEGYSSNDSSQEEWQTIEEHTKRVVDCARVINYAINMPSKFSNWVESGARWHDAGKAHEAFQALINKDNAPINVYGQKHLQTPGGREDCQNIKWGTKY
jgi:CRISPR-associated endonuclease/helicase Cas3